MSWIGAAIGLSVPNPETANTAGFIWLFPVTFLSNAFVATPTLPDWLKPVGDWNPISSTIQACRDLFGNAGLRGAARSTSFPMEHPVVTSLFWSLLILMIFVPLSIRKYRVATAR
jgi:ABC-2 type transport system permease protein